jgi:hypothetical protein
LCSVTSQIGQHSPIDVVFKDNPVGNRLHKRTTNGPVAEDDRTQSCILVLSLSTNNRLIVVRPEFESRLKSLCNRRFFQLGRNHISGALHLTHRLDNRSPSPDRLANQHLTLPQQQQQQQQIGTIKNCASLPSKQLFCNCRFILPNSLAQQSKSHSIVRQLFTSSPFSASSPLS